MKRLLVITHSWISLAISPSASALDCNKAKLSVEKIICKDAELTEFDDTLNVSYQYARRAQYPSATFKEHNVAWEKSTRS